MRRQKYFRIGGALLFIVGIVYWLAGKQLYNYEPISTVEAAAKPALIVVLAGGKKRIESAFQLFSLGNSTSLLVAGAGPRTSLSSLVHTNLNTELIAALTNRMDSITVETESRNTIENAYAVARFLNINPQFKEIILITSSYHMRRSLLIFRHILSSDIKLYAYSPPQEPIARENWMYSFKGVLVTGQELVKFLFAGMVMPQLANF